MSEKCKHHHAQLATPQWKSKKNQMIHYDLELFVNEMELSLVFPASHTLSPSLCLFLRSASVCRGNDIEFNLDFFFHFSFSFFLNRSYL